jgi:type I restriction enzyme S subunit
MSKIGSLIAQYCQGKVVFKRLGDIAKIGTGSSNTKDADINGKYPFYVRSQDIKQIATYEFDEEAIIIPGEGGIGEIFHYVNGRYALHQRAYRISFTDNNIKTKFAYYYLMHYFKDFILKHAVTATVTSIRKPMIASFSIPLPPLEVQEEIVSILDKFDALVNDLLIGLPAEITVRRKQYEYYRDKLLAFRRCNQTSSAMECVARRGNLSKEEAA